jgi:uncharacterized protein (TIGR02271 family)
MPTFTHEELDGKTIKSSDGSKIGKINNIYLDTDTEKPEWASVSTGMFGSKEALVPLAAVTREGDDFVVPFDKDTVKEAPHHDPGDELTRTQEAELFTYYGIPYGGETVTATGGPQTGTVEAPAAGGDVEDTSGPNTDTAMTRSEERLQVGTESVESGRVRLRKYIVTENVTQTVPITREEVRVEREPITEANRDAAMSGADLSEEQAEITLHEDRPVTVKETVPIERISLTKDTVTDETEVSETLREERIDTEGADERSALR